MRSEGGMKKKVGMQIFGEEELAAHISHGGKVFSHCISIRNTHDRMPPLPVGIANGFKSILHLEFHDVEKREWLPPDFADQRIPELRDVVRAMMFGALASLDPSFTGFTVHCWRGQSRSTAVALGLIYLVLKDEGRSMKYLLNVRPEALPLPRITRFWDRILGSRLELEVMHMRAMSLPTKRRRAASLRTQWSA